METVTLDAAKEDLERLVARAAAGEEIVIQVKGYPAARLVWADPELKPWEPGTPRPLGLFPEFRMLPGFEDPLDAEEQSAFDGTVGSEADTP